MEQVQQYLPHLVTDEPALRELAPGFLIASDPMRRLAKEIERVAAADAAVLITGETGAGKELAARTIHEWSKRADRPFKVIDCTRLTPELAESELFGHERGAFTGAYCPKKGLFAAADGGTVFLDEVSELPLSTQAKFLRVIDNLELRPVGGIAYRPIRARVVAATNQDLAELVRTRRFRQDLFYRFDVLRLRVPPLRERQADIRVLAAHFLGAGAPEKQFSPEAMGMLEAYPWPGNVRELKNFVTRVGAANASRIVGNAEVVKLLLPAKAKTQLTPQATIEIAQAASRDELGRLTYREMSRKYFAALAAEHGGNKERMARASGLSRRTVYRWMQEFGLDSRQPPGEG